MYIIILFVHNDKNPYKFKSRITINLFHYINQQSIVLSLPRPLVRHVSFLLLLFWFGWHNMPISKQLTILRNIGRESHIFFITVIDIHVVKFNFSTEHLFLLSHHLHLFKVLNLEIFIPYHLSRQHHYIVLSLKLLRGLQVFLAEIIC